MRKRTFLVKGNTPFLIKLLKILLTLQQVKMFQNVKSQHRLAWLKLQTTEHHLSIITQFDPSLRCLAPEGNTRWKQAVLHLVLQTVCRSSSSNTFKAGLHSSIRSTWPSQRSRSRCLFIRRTAPMLLIYNEPYIFRDVGDVCSIFSRVFPYTCYVLNIWSMMELPVFYVWLNLPVSHRLLPFSDSFLPVCFSFLLSASEKLMGEKVLEPTQPRSLKFEVLFPRNMDN